MINNYLERQIKEFFPYLPTVEQENAIKKLSEFLCSPKEGRVFLLRGYAGTGKTSLVGALVHALDRLKQKSVLLAPTGRAAKVFAAYAGHPAFTIHKKIYRQKTFADEMSNFSLNDNLTTHTLYIVDEASMISNEGLSGAVFGTGRLLDDLVEFVYSGQGCRLLLMGDTAQLPPVGEELSPALYAEALQGYGLEVTEAELTQVVRQERQSGILWNATALRRLIREDACHALPKIHVSGFADIKVVPGNELIDALSACYDRDGLDETIVICRSNKRANIYNNGIRAQILWREEELETGDRLMVAKNNYYWTEKQKTMDFIANGETVVVRRVRRTRELYGFRFARGTGASFPNRTGGLCRHPAEARPYEKDESRSTLQCLASEIRLCRHVPQGARRPMGQRVPRPRLPIRRVPDTRLFPLALHRLYPSHRDSLSGELSAGASGVSH